MTRTGARLKRCPRLFARSKFSGCLVIAINHYLIKAKIRNERVPFRTIEYHAVSVWSFLLFLDT